MEASDKAIQQANASQDAKQGTVLLASPARDNATAPEEPTTESLSDLKTQWPPGSGPPGFCFPTPEEHIPSILHFVMLAMAGGQKPTHKKPPHKSVNRPNRRVCKDILNICLRRDWDELYSYWTIDHPDDGRFIVWYFEAKGTTPAHWRRVSGSGYTGSYPKAAVAYPLDTKCLQQGSLSKVFASALANVSSKNAATRAGMISSTDPHATEMEIERPKKRLCHGNIKPASMKSLTQGNGEGDATSPASTSPSYQKGKGDKQVEVIEID